MGSISDWDVMSDAAATLDVLRAMLPAWLAGRRS